MALSARNQLKGRVKSVVLGAVDGRGHRRGGRQRIVSVITRHAVESLDIKAGDEVTAVIKSTEVLAREVTRVTLRDPQLDWTPRGTLSPTATRRASTTCACRSLTAATCACTYCMPPEGVPRDPTTTPGYEEFAAFTRVAAGCGISKVRVTGGEPLVRHGCATSSAC